MTAAVSETRISHTFVKDTGFSQELFSSRGEQTDCVCVAGSLWLLGSAELFTLQNTDKNSLLIHNTQQSAAASFSVCVAPQWWTHVCLIPSASKHVN